MRSDPSDLGIEAVGVAHSMYWTSSVTAAFFGYDLNADKSMLALWFKVKPGGWSIITMRPVFVEDGSKIMWDSNACNLLRHFHPGKLVR